MLGPYKRPLAVGLLAGLSIVFINFLKSVLHLSDRSFFFLAALNGVFVAFVMLGVHRKDRRKKQ